MRRALTLTLLFLVMTGWDLTGQTIKLTIFPGLTSIDFAALDFTSGINITPRLLQVDIMPAGAQVYVEGKVDWKKDQASGFQQLFVFQTEVFTARTFYNDEFNNTDVEIRSSEFNSDLLEENLKKGKPSGVFGFTLKLFIPSGQFLSEDYQEVSFLNPTPPSIIVPVNGSSYPVASIPVMWTPSIGATSYKIKANYFADNDASPEQALNAGTPLINDFNVGDVTSVNLREALDRQPQRRELLADTNIVLVVKAIVSSPGGDVELPSPIVVFNTNTQGAPISDEEGIRTLTVQQNEDLMRLAALLSEANPSEEIVQKIRSGEIKASDIEFTDENGNLLSFSDFVQILNYLEANKESIITINFSSR